MCIAIGKPIGTRMPNETILRNCMSANADGAGIAYAVAGQVRIIKGLMTMAEFRSAIIQAGIEARRAGHKSLDSVGMLLHFRIGTHGKKRDPEHTHPFPLTESRELMERLDVTTDIAVIHNGIISECCSHDRADPMSDTMHFIADYLSPLARALGTSHPTFWRIINRVLNGSNKVAMLNADGQIAYLGHWPARESNGMRYSNTSWRGSDYGYTADPRRGGKREWLPSTKSNPYAFTPTRDTLPSLPTAKTFDEIFGDGDERLIDKLSDEEYNYLCRE